MSKKLGKIPTTGMVVLDKDISNFEGLDQELDITDDLSIIGTISLGGGTSAKITITPFLIMSPRNGLNLVIKKDGDKNDQAAIRALDCAFNYFSKESYFLLGYTEGKIKQRILIAFFKGFNLSTYSIIENDNELSNIFPKGMPEGYSVN